MAGFGSKVDLRVVHRRPRAVAAIAPEWRHYRLQRVYFERGSTTSSPCRGKPFEITTVVSIKPLGSLSLNIAAERNGSAFL